MVSSCGTPARRVAPAAERDRRDTAGPQAGARPNFASRDLPRSAPNDETARRRVLPVRDTPQPAARARNAVSLQAPQLTMNTTLPSTDPPTGTLSFRDGHIVVDLALREVRVDGRLAKLGGRAFDLLAALMARRGRIVSKDELLHVVWAGVVVEENNLEVQVVALRKVLGHDAIVTVQRHGYRLALAPDEIARDAAPDATSAMKQLVCALAEGRCLVLVAPDRPTQAAHARTSRRRPAVRELAGLPGWVFGGLLDTSRG